MDEDVKYKKHKEQSVLLENRGVPGYNQDIIYHIQIVSMFALVFWIMMLNIKSIKNKSFRWKTGESMDTTKILFVIFKSNLCPPSFFGRDVKYKEYKEKRGVHKYTRDISHHIQIVSMFAPVFLDDDVKYKKHKDNPFCCKTGRTWIQPRYHLSYSNHNYVRPRFLDDDVKYKKHKGQVVGKRGCT